MDEGRTTDDDVEMNGQREEEEEKGMEDGDILCEDGSATVEDCDHDIRISCGYEAVSAFASE